MLTRFILALIIVMLSSAAPVAAQIDAEVQTPAGPATFAGSMTLWIAIAIGIIASSLTAWYGLRIRGSSIGVILCFFASGMFLVVLGFLTVVAPWAPPQTQKIVHDLLFIAGYLLLLVGAIKIKKVAGG